jgi:ketosteroid isomerase-like protein
MRAIILFLSIAAIMVIAGCNPKTGASKDQALADSLLKANENAYNSGDAQKIADLFTDDALSIGNGKNTWTMDYTVQGKTLPTKGLSTLIWKKQQDKTWKTVLEHSVFDVNPF